MQLVEMKFTKIVKERCTNEKNISNMMEFYSLWYKESEQDVIERLMNHGMTRREAYAYYQRGQEITDFLKNNPKATVTWLRGKLITFGRK